MQTIHGANKQICTEENSLMCECVCAGRTLEVLVEGVNPRDPAQAMGRTRHNKLCFFPGDGAALKGELVDVKIEGIRAYTLAGTLA